MTLHIDWSKTLWNQITMNVKWCALKPDITFQIFFKIKIDFIILIMFKINFCKLSVYIPYFKTSKTPYKHISSHEWRVSWLVRSFDFKPLDLCLWDHVKPLVYAINIYGRNLEHLVRVSTSKSMTCRHLLINHWYMLLIFMKEISNIHYDFLSRWRLDTRS